MTVDRCNAELAAIAELPRDLPLSERIGAEHGWLDWWEEKERLMSKELKAPFPWFGGKSRVAHLVWDRFGNVPNYVEPFAGSLAVLLARPHAARIETVNDKDCFLANFWRAVKNDPDAVAEYADWPVNEADLRARHMWLVDRDEFRERVRTDAEYYDARVAGWWVWGISQWIGSGWCSRPEWDRRGNGSRADRGIHGKRTQLGRGFKGDIGGKAIAVADQLPNLSGDSGAAGRGTAASGKRGQIQTWFNALAERLRHVRVCCGEWDRVTGPRPTFKIGLTGVFLDPPYSDNAGRVEVYGVDDFQVAHAAREWAIANGENPLMRIALCGYDGEHGFPPRWECVAWKAAGGYGSQGEGRGRENASRERIWFSPHCLKPPSLFGESLSESFSCPETCDQKEQNAE